MIRTKINMYNFSFLYILKIQIIIQIYWWNDIIVIRLKYFTLFTVSQSICHLQSSVILRSSYIRMRKRRNEPLNVFFCYNITFIVRVCENSSWKYFRVLSKIKLCSENSFRCKIKHNIRRKVRIIKKKNTKSTCVVLPKYNFLLSIIYYTRRPSHY